MASGGAVGGSSIYKSSQEAFDYECDPCKVDDAITEAKHYCPVCQEYLCDDCRVHHRRSRATKAHKILSGEDMPKNPSSGLIIRPQDMCACGQNVVDYYCEDHKEVFCLTCKTVRHRSCDVEQLDVLAKTKNNRSQLNVSINELNELRLLAMKTESLQDSLLESLAENENNCEETIRAFRGEINELVDKLERKAIDDLKDRCTAQKNELTDRKAVCSNIKDKLDADLKTSTDVSNGNDLREIFIQNLQLSKTLSLYRDAIKIARSETISKIISFEKGSLLEEIQLRHLGHIEEETLNQECQNSFLNLTLEDVSEFSLQTNVSRIRLIAGNIIALIWDNKTINLFDSNFKVVKHFKSKESVYDITVISDSEILCTVPFKKQMHYVEVYPDMKLKNCINLSKCFQGIVYFKGHIFACCCDGNNTEVQVLTKDGIIQRVVCLQNCGVEEIPGNKTNCLCISTDGCRLYVSEFGRKRLACIKTNGDLIFSYVGPDVQKPRDIIVDDNDNCIICDQDSGLKVFKSDGSFYRLLRNMQNPLWLAWRKNNNTLIVCDGKRLIVYAMKFY